MRLTSPFVVLFTMLLYKFESKKKTRNNLKIFASLVVGNHSKNMDCYLIWWLPLFFVDLLVIHFANQIVIFFFSKEMRTLKYERGGGKELS